MSYGFVYKIVSEKGNMVYIGSTSDLTNRWKRHVEHYSSDKRGTTAELLFDEYGIDNCSLEVIEMVKYKEKKELYEREEYWIKNTPEETLIKLEVNTPEEILIKPKVVNKKNPTPFTEERAKESKRAYYEKNKDTEEYKQRTHESSVRYMESHREEQREKARKYAEENPEKIKESNKIQYQKIKQNQERYQARMARILEWVTCECGTKVQRGNLSRHKKSNVHQAFLQK